MQPMEFHKMCVENCLRRDSREMSVYTKKTMVSVVCDEESGLRLHRPVQAHCLNLLLISRVFMYTVLKCGCTMST